MSDQDVMDFVRNHAQHYYKIDSEPVTINDVWLVKGCDYADYYVAVDAQPGVADIAYFMVDEHDGKLQVRGVEY